MKYRIKYRERRDRRGGSLPSDLGKGDGWPALRTLGTEGMG